jgi:hypothetical protein
VTTEADAKTFVAASEKESRLCKTFCFIVKPVPQPPAGQGQEEVEEAGEDDEAEWDEKSPKEEEEEEEEEEEPAKKKAKAGRSIGGAQTADEAAAFWTSDVLADLHKELNALNFVGSAAKNGYVYMPHDDSFT